VAILRWPVYVATLRAKLACAAVLLVLAPDPAVAAWARRPIELGHPGSGLAPVVIEFKDVPWVRDRDVVSRLPGPLLLPLLSGRRWTGAAFGSRRSSAVSRS